MKILFYIIIIITSYTVWGQEQGQSISRDTVKIEKLTVKPEFPGGAKAFASYVNKEYGNTSNNGHGKMYIKFYRGKGWQRKQCYNSGKHQ
jgi:hypothetical protein